MSKNIPSRIGCSKNITLPQCSKKQNVHDLDPTNSFISYVVCGLLYQLLEYILFVYKCPCYSRLHKILPTNEI